MRRIPFVVFWSTLNSRVRSVGPILGVFTLLSGVPEFFGESFRPHVMWSATRERGRLGEPSKEPVFFLPRWYLRGLSLVIMLAFSTTLAALGKSLTNAAGFPMALSTINFLVSLAGGRVSFALILQMCPSRDRMERCAGRRDRNRPSCLQQART